MTLILSLADYWKLCYEVEPIQQNSELNEFDITFKYPTLFAEGYHRHIKLRDCILLDIYNYQQQKSLIVECPEREHLLEFRFYILIDSPYKNVPYQTGEYFLSGSGMACECASLEEGLMREVAVAIHIKPEMFRSFAGDTSGELPKELQHLIGRSDQLTYERYRTQTPGMLLALQQILQCPYQGVTKRVYLESKVWELSALVIEQEIQIYQGFLEVHALRPSEIDCVYHAKEILLKNHDNPPSLLQLARQVGLNDRKLKQGFRSVFGTTVFGYLHNYRMELAHNLLIQGNMNITEVAQKVGYASLPSFSNAFRKKFGISPKSCHR
ncbi:helix-turn-helix transcriptional regulator [Scytonema sp. NUACC26]|uniref:helix-turn-helix transcriptional regulator n=1 Tax=Scytonema sp. NUACC26 TaxID=3140176 RepID=UPI0034DBBFD5